MVDRIDRYAGFFKAMRVDGIGAVTRIGQSGGHHVRPEEPREMAGTTPFAGEHTRELLVKMGYATPHIDALFSSEAVG